MRFITQKSIHHIYLKKASIKRYGGFTRDDLKANERAKERTKLKEEGYADEDVEKILLGAKKDDFKPKDGGNEIEEDPLADLG